MAKVDLPERKKSDPADTGASVSVTPKPARRRRWWPKLLLLVVTAVAVLPTVVSIFGFVPGVLQKVHPKLASAVHFQTIHLHWWAPVEIAGLKVVDLSSPSTDASTDAIPLIQVSRLTTTQPLWKIMFHVGRGTSFILAEPKLNLVISEQGSNLQHTVDAVFGDTSGSSEPTFPLAIELRDGAVSVRSTTQQLSTVVTNINGTWSSLRSSSLLPELQLAADIQDAADVSLSEQQTTGGNSASRRSLDQRLAANLQDLVTDFPVVPLESFSDMPLNSSDPAGSTGGNSARPASIHAEIRSAADSEEQQTIRLAARHVDLRLLQPLLTMFEINLLCEGEASCDLQAQLAGKSLQDGLAGRILFSGEQVRIRQTNWAAGEWLQLGTTVASGAVAIAHDGILLNQVSVQTDIITATGTGELRMIAGEDSTELPSAGTTNSAAIQGKLDLAKAVSMLPRTIGLRDDVTIRNAQLIFAARTEPVPAGTGGSTSSKPLARWRAMLQNDKIEASRAEQTFAIDSLVRLDAVGPLTNGLPEIAQIRISGEFGAIECSPAAEGFLLNGQVQPTKIWQQIQQFVEIPQPGIRGDLKFETRVALLPEVTTLTSLTVTSDDLQASSNGLRVHHFNPMSSMLDGTLHVEGSGRAIQTLLAPWHNASWLAETSRVVADLAANADQKLQLRAIVQPGTIAAAASHPVRSVAQRSKTVPVAGNQRRVAGGAPLQFAGQNSSARSPSMFQVDQAIADLQISASKEGSVCQIEKGTIQLPGIASVVSGTVQIVGSSVELDLTAETQYDLNILCSRLLAADSFIRLNGRGRDTFRLTGSPSMLQPGSAASSAAGARGLAGDSVTAGAGLTPLRASGSISWESGSLWGLQAGPASVKAVLENGLLRTEPIQCRLNSGEISVMPQFDLVRQRLQLATGSRVQNVDLTPELGREWLAYLTPMLADAASVSGLVSARVERFDYDLNAPQNSDIAAVLTIHSGSASPGPSLLPLLEAIDVIRRADGSDRSSVVRSIVLPAQDVPVEVRQGFVMHQGLTIELNGYRAVSSGGVGLNRQVQLVLDIPLEKSGTGNSARSIKVPVRGTIDRLQPDTAALLQNLGTQAIEKKLNNQLDRQLNKLLDKL